MAGIFFKKHPNKAATFFLKRCEQAYRQLVLEENPDGELLKFLNQYPQFADAVGGVPDWLDVAGS